MTPYSWGIGFIGGDMYSGSDNNDCGDGTGYQSVITTIITDSEDDLSFLEGE